MKIADKLLLMIAAACISVFALAVTGLYGMSKIEDGLENMNRNSIPSIVMLDEAGRDFLRLRVRMLNHIMNDNPEQEKKLEEEIGKLSASVQSELDRYGREMTSDQKDKDLLAADLDAIKAYYGLRDKGLALSREHKKVEAQHLFTENAALPRAATDALVAHAQYNVDLAKQEGEMARVLYGKLTWILIIVAVFAVAVSAVVGFTIRKGVVSSLSSLRSMLGKVESSLDFTQRAPVERQDEVGETVVSVNRLVERMQGSLRQIAEQTEQVSVAATSLRETAAIVTDSASSQSASAADMAATVEEMTVSINHVADQAAEANQLSGESGERAVDGERVIGLTVSEINGISSTVQAAASYVEKLDHDSQRVGEVVAVIKEVADQTNLLALNAAIEAARAGEQGRGFAVVADEVRKLAERTAQSTQMIAETISLMQVNARNTVEGMGEVGQRVGSGVERAREASDAIAAIRESSGNAVNRVGEISNAIREQGVASTSIAQQVERIAQMSEENHAAAVNTSDTAVQLDGLARNMKAIVSQYRI